MALYDDGGVQFAQERMDEAKAFKIQQAKKQEKFAKKLTVFDGAVKGLNYLVNAAADKAEQNQSFKKASYETMMKRAETLRTQDATRLESGVSRLDYLTNNIYTKMVEQAKEDYPLADLGLVMKAFRAEARTLAKQRLPEYEEMMNTANNFGTYENFEKDYAKSSEIPRSIFGWMTSGVKNIVRGETEESIKYKAEKEKDALYGTKLFDKFTNLESSFKAYDAVTSSPIDISKVLEQAEKDNLVKGKIFEKGVKIAPQTTTSRGTTTVENILVIPRVNPKTGNIEANESTNIILDKSVSRTADGYIKPDDVTKITDMVRPEHRDAVSKIIYAKGQPYIENADAALQFINKNPLMLAVDWGDEKNIVDSFPKWYSNQIKYATYARDDGRGNVVNISISRETDTKGVYEIDPRYSDKAQELGLDEKTAFEQYQQYGTNIGLANSSYDNSDDAITMDTILSDGYELISKGMDKAQLQTWNDIQSDGWYDVFQKQIDKADADYEKNNDLRLSLLSANFNMELIYPQLNLTGTYSIYRDNKDKKIYIKSN